MSWCLLNYLELPYNIEPPPLIIDGKLKFMHVSLEVALNCGSAFQYVQKSDVGAGT
jgi:hypothetical protein